MNRFIHVDEKVTQWHPCCYILSKLWNVKMAESVAAKSIAAKDDPDCMCYLKSNHF